MMLEGAGFEVFDLGINTDADEFLAALDEHKPDILGHVGAAHDDDAVHEGRHRDARSPRASATTTSCSSVARRSTKSSVTPIGADAYCRDAAVAAETAKTLVKSRRDRVKAEPPGPSVA